MAIAAIFCAYTLEAGVAHAQVAGSPGSIERTIPRLWPQSAPAPEVGRLVQTTSAASQKFASFTLGAVHIEAATAFSPATLSEDFETYLTTEVDQSKLAEIAARITERYRRAGYLLSYAVVPAQDIHAGIARIAVREGSISAITVEGAGWHTAAIEAAFAPLLSERPMHSRSLERAIGLIRDMPGFQVSDIRISRTDPDIGQHSLKIVLMPNRVKGQVYTDNRGADPGGRARFYSSGSVSSLVTTGDEIRFDLFAIPGRKQRYLYGQITASLPLGPNGLRIATAISAGDLQQRNAGDVNGKSRNVSAQFSYPLLRSRALTLIGKFALNDWRGTTNLNDVPGQRDRIRVARLGLDLSNESKTRLNGEFAVSQGLDFAGMTQVGDPLATRPDASGRFTKAAFAMQVMRPMSERVSVQLAVAGQYSNRPLLSVEEFAIGGSRFGRAFDFNDLTGDRGIAAGVEAAYRLAPPKNSVQHVDLFGYIDGGRVFEAGSSAGQARSLASAGIGTRLSIDGISFSAEIGVPLKFDGGRKLPRGFLSAYRVF